jgi:hypothetical protein
MDTDEILCIFYAAAESVKTGEVGEVEFETGEDEAYMRITVRREVSPSNYHSVSNFGKDWQGE